MNIVGIMQWCITRGLNLSISKDLTYRIRDRNDGMVLVTESLETLREYCYVDTRDEKLPKGL